MIIVTGAAGFIGSALAHDLGQTEKDKLVLVDQLGTGEKWKNLLGLENCEFWDREELFENLSHQQEKPRLIIHMGACTDTSETNSDYLMRWNYQYTRQIWDYCTAQQIPLIYASSAATYGAGHEGYSDDHKTIPSLKPLNPYGFSKQIFDLHALKQTKTPPKWYGVKFFNVFGYGEFHKGKMASVAFHGYNQVVKTGQLTLFRSHKEGIKDGEQKRDFVYIKDVLKVIRFLMSGKAPSGIYNCGSGKAETFLTLSKALFRALEKPEKINWVDTPVEIRDSYQYFTQAEMSKIRSAGFTENMTPFEQAVQDYARQLRAGMR